jgi:hypothetical protein
MEASGGPDDGERRSRRTGILIGFLAAAVLALGVALAVVLANDDDDGGSPTMPTAATRTETVPTTVTTTAPPTVTTTTTPSSPTINQVQAKSAAARGAAAEVQRAGITIPPGDWDVRCTASGGGTQASTWSCQVSGNGGQCQGTITSFARAPGVAGTRDREIGCGE